MVDCYNMLIGMRQDLTIATFNTGVITDEAGKIVANLFQQDMTAVRCVMRVDYLLAKPRHRSGGDRSPVAMVAAPSTPSKGTGGPARHVRST